MKEYVLFVENDGNIDAYCGGHFVLPANGLDLTGNIATLWRTIEKRGERVVGIRETSYDAVAGTRTLVLETVPAR